jgi:hypothetical protein
VTSFPVEANYGHWWLTTLPSWNRLHAIPGREVDRYDEDAVETLCEAPGPILTSACGREAHWTMPGVISRLGMARCAHCCRKLGIAAGNGTPANGREDNASLPDSGAGLCHT